MTKIIEQMKTKKLAKKIAGVTLGAFAFGAMSAVPAYAAVYLHGGEPGTNEYKGKETSDYNVTIDASATEGTELKKNYTIYGNLNEMVSGVITGTVTTGNVTDDTLTGIIVYGGRYNSGTGEVKGSNNEVTWKVKDVTLNQVFGFCVSADGVSAEGTKVEIAEGVKVQATDYTPLYIQGTFLTGNSENATATGTKVTLNGVTADDVGVYGDEVKSAQKEATSTDAEIKITGGTYNSIYGALVQAAGTGVGEGTQLTLDKVTMTSSASEVIGDIVLSDTLAKATGTGEADKPTVSITGGTLHKVYGAYLDASTSGGTGAEAIADGITVKLKDANLTVANGSHLYGVSIGQIKKSTIDNTKIDITGGENKGVYGIYKNFAADSLTANTTELTLNAATVVSNIYGIYAYQPKETKATDTKITLKNLDDKPSTANSIYGVFLGGGRKSETAGTVVDITGGEIQGYVYGTSISVSNEDDLGKATGTQVTLNNTNVGTVYGDNIEAYKEAKSDDAKVEITGGKVGINVYGANIDAGGGSDDSEATATNTTVTIKNISEEKEVNNVTAAKVKAKKLAKADTTELNITGGKLTYAYGAYVSAVGDKGEAIADTKTTVTLNGVKISSLANGVTVEANKKATANTTELNINGGEYGRIVGVSAYAYGDEGVANAKNTTVTLKDDATVTNYVRGADVAGVQSATADTTKVDITGGNVAGDIDGAYLYGDTEGEVTAKTTDVILNKVTAEKGVAGVVVTGVTNADISGTTIDLQGSTITETVHGVFFENEATDTATIKNTTIILDGTEVEKSVFGVSAQAANGVTTDNTQIIFQGVRSIVKGTVVGEALNKAKSSTNTSLTINNIGNEVGNIANFDTINFKLPDNLQANDVMLKLTKAEDTDLKNTTVTTAKVVDAQYAKLNDKDKIYLIDKEGGNLLLKDGTVGQEVILVENSTTTKKGTTALDGNDLVLNISEGGKPGPVPPGPVPPGPVPPEPEPEEEEKADNRKDMTETIAASVALLNSGADFATEQALSEAKAAAKEGTMQGATSMSPFAAFGGSSMKYKSGSHIDAKGWNAALGFAKEQGELTYGIAVEHGQANYDSYVNAAHGEGKNKYTGGVIFAELKKESGAHFDASFRAGRAKSDYDATLYVGGIATPTRYDTSSTYLGFSIGGGKETKVSEAGTLDLYARYYFNHLGGSNTKTADGRELEFKDSDSSRLRLGTRFTQKMDERNKLYAGLAWQYEFAGKAKAVINGVDAPSPSMKGHSGMAELGWKAKAGKNLDIDLGVNGWLGKQRGIAGNIGFKWTF